MSYLLFVTPRLGSSEKSFRVSSMARKVKKVLNIMKLLDTGRCPITSTDINCRGCDYCNYHAEIVEDGLRWMVCTWGYTYENIKYLFL